jgi:4-hydroxy-tetrahydrodipicolinate synthase
MAKRSARALSRTRHLDQLGGGRWPFCDGTILSVLDALRTHRWRVGHGRAAPALAALHALYAEGRAGEIPRAQGVHIEFKSLRTFVVADRSAG